MARKLTAAAGTREISTVTLAVLPFQADEKLSKKRVNFAVSEILTKDFLKLGKFTVIERAQLEEVLKEQKLGLSGAMDSQTAARIGKLAGAKLLILGNVMQIGNSYQLTAKLIDSETGEIITSEIIEVPVTTFDEDADRYLVLVPEHNAIGVYGIFAQGPARVKRLPTVTRGATTVTPTNTSAGQLYYYGAGLRYGISPKWMADASVVSTEIHIGKIEGDYSEMNLCKLLTYRLFWDRTFLFSEVFRAHAAVGATKFGPLNFEYYNPWTGYNDIPLTRILQRNNSPILPTFKLGLEWKPTPRIGCSIFGFYYVGKMSMKTVVRFLSGEPDAIIRQIDSPAFTAEGNVSLYF